MLYNSQGANVDELLDLPIEPTKNFDNHTNINLVSDELFYDLRMLVDWTQEQKREIPKILKDRERILQLNLKINQLVQENSLLTILSDKHKMINEKYKENIRLQISPPKSRQPSKSPPKKPVVPRKKSKSNGGNNKQEQLKKILD